MATLVWLPVAFDISKYQKDLIGDLPDTSSVGKEVMRLLTSSIHDTDSGTGRNSPETSNDEPEPSETDEKLKVSTDNEQTASTETSPIIKEEELELPPQKENEKKEPVDMEEGELSDSEDETVAPVKVKPEMATPTSKHSSSATAAQPKQKSTPTTPKKSNKKCEFFTRGHCYLGATCANKHLFPDPQPDPRYGNYHFMADEQRQRMGLLGDAPPYLPIMNPNRPPPMAPSYNRPPPPHYEHDTYRAAPTGDIFADNRQGVHRPPPQMPLPPAVRQAPLQNFGYQPNINYNVRDNEPQMPSNEGWVDPWGREVSRKHPKRAKERSSRKTKKASRKKQHKRRRSSSYSSYSSSSSRSHPSSCSTCSSDSSSSGDEARKQRRSKRLLHSGSSSEDESMANSARRLVPKRKKAQNAFGLFRFPEKIEMEETRRQSGSGSGSYSSVSSESEGDEQQGARGSHGAPPVFKAAKPSQGSAKQRQRQREKLMAELKRVEAQIASKHLTLGPKGK